MKIARIFSDFVENAEKAQAQLLEIFRFRFNFHHDYTRDLITKKKLSAGFSI